MKYDIENYFYPVGQGLFSAGFITNEYNKKFCWIYDCGTNSPQKYLNNSIDILDKSMNGNKSIDLFFISHFDKDHISGFEKIAEKYSIKNLIIPYMTFGERILISLNKKYFLKRERFIFLINPIEYFLKTNKVERVILVPKSSKTIENEKIKERFDFGEDFELNENCRDLNSVENEEYPNISNTDKVKVLIEGKYFILNNYFEFIPYNDSELLYSFDKKYKIIINEYVNKILENIEDSGGYIYKIKEIYDKIFGSNYKYKRNLSSLFLYFDFTFKKYNDDHCHEKLDKKFGDKEMIKLNKVDLGDIDLIIDSAVFYTGDGFLDSKYRLDKLFKYFSKERIRRINIFQVMHHGSKENWYPGLANEIKPLYSIFSADRITSKKHPSQEVVDDFKESHSAFIDRNSESIFYIFIKSVFISHSINTISKEIIYPKLKAPDTKIDSLRP